MKKLGRCHSVMAGWALACSFLLAGPLSCAQEFHPPPPSRTENLPLTAVDLYIDATASLQGFVKSGRVTTFAYFTRVLETRLHSLFPPSRATYGLHRFGLISQPFNDVKESWSPGFYAPRKGYEDTDLSVVAREYRSGHLVVILTDLFQSDSHIEAFRSQLLQHGLGKDFQFALVAFRAEFDGKIYDVPPAKSTVAYRGPRPAYAMLLGPARQLRDLLSALLNQPNDLGTEVYAVLFSSKVGTPASPFHDLKASNPKQPNETGSFDADGFDAEESLLPRGAGEAAKALRLSRSAPRPAVEFSETVVLQPYESVPQAGSLKLSHEVRMCNTEQPGFLDRLFSTKANESDKKDPCPAVDPDFDIVYGEPYSRAIVTRSGLDRLKVNVKLDLGARGDPVRGVRARSSKVYIVHLTVGSAERNTAAPAWVANFSQDPRQPFVGSKTPDLMDFLTSMQDSVNQAAPVTVLNSYIYIDSK